MATENGSAFLLKVGDGAAPPSYRTVAGLRTTQLSVNGEAVTVTTKDSRSRRTLLSGAGVSSVSVSAVGICAGSAAEVRVRGHALAGTIDDFELSFESGERLRRRFLVSRSRSAQNGPQRRRAIGGTVGAGQRYLLDDVNAALVALVNPSMSLESFDDAALLGGANRVMVGDELLQFAIANLSRRAFNGWRACCSGGWRRAVAVGAARGSSVLTDVAVPIGGAALRPLAPAHGRIVSDRAGGVFIS